MCHSVEMYIPKLARDAAEHRLGAAGLAARRDRAVAVAGWRVLARFGRWMAGMAQVVRSGAGASGRSAPQATE